MGLFDFVKDAGEKLFGGEDDDKAPKAAEPQVRTREMALADRAKGESLTRMVSGMKLGVDAAEVKFREGLATDHGDCELPGGPRAGGFARRQYSGRFPCGRPDDRGDPGAGGQDVYREGRGQLEQDCQGVLRQPDEIHGNLQSEPADAQGPGQDLPRPGAADSRVGLNGQGGFRPPGSYVLEDGFGHGGTMRTSISRTTVLVCVVLCTCVCGGGAKLSPEIEAHLGVYEQLIGEFEPKFEAVRNNPPEFAKVADSYKQKTDAWMNTLGTVTSDLSDAEGRTFKAGIDKLNRRAVKMLTGA